MPSSGDPSLSAAEIAFEQAFALIESADSDMQRKGLKALLKIMKSGEIPDKTIHALMTIDRDVTLGTLDENTPHQDISDLIAEVCGASVMADQRALGIDDTEVSALASRTALTVVKDAFDKLSASSIIEQMEGLSTLQRMSASSDSTHIAAFMTQMMEDEHKSALLNLAASSLPYLREAAQAVWDAYENTWASKMRKPKGPDEPFLG